MQPDDQEPREADVIEIPASSLSSEALRSLVEEFVTRDGTDYGTREKEVEDKVRDITRQLERGEARIIFDRETGTANIVTAEKSRPASD